MRRVGIYARVSTDEQARVEEGSLKNQVETLRRYVDGENLKHIGKWGTVIDVYVDDGYSAKDLNRPQVRRLISDIQKGVIDTVLITEISRLSRCVSNWIDLRRFFAENNAAFIASRQNFDTSTAMGRAMLNFAIEFAQLEREMTAERVKASCLSRAERGLWTGGPPPYGLDLGKSGHLVVNEAKKVIADEIVDILLNKSGDVPKTIRFLKENNYKKDGNLDWDSSSFIRWIRNFALIGKREVNKGNKNIAQENLPEKERYKVVKSPWNALLDEEKWQRANERITENHCTRKVEQWTFWEYILTGLIECPNGHRLVADSSTGRGGTKRPRYRHSPKTNCDCHITTIPAGRIEPVVLDVLKKCVRRPEVVEQLVVKANEDQKKQQPDFDKAVFGTENRIKVIQRKIDKTTDAILEAEGNDKAMWNDKLRTLQAEKAAVENELASLKDERLRLKQEPLDAKQIVKALDQLVTNFDDLPYASKESLLKSVLDSVVVDKDEIRVNITNPGFSMSWDDGTGVNLNEMRSVQWNGWLLGTGSNRRPSD